MQLREPRSSSVQAPAVVGAVARRARRSKAGRAMLRATGRGEDGAESEAAMETQTQREHWDGHE